MRLLRGDFVLVTWNEIVLVPQLMFLSHISWYIFPCHLIAHELLSLGDFVPCKVQGRIFQKWNSVNDFFSQLWVIQYLNACLTWSNDCTNSMLLLPQSPTVPYSKLICTQKWISSDSVFPNVAILLSYQKHNQDKQLPN